MDRIFPGDILFEMFLDVSGYGRNVRIIPLWRVAGETEPESEVAIWEDGQWKRVKCKDYENVHDIPVLHMDRRWAEQLRDELIKKLGDGKKDATEQELNATRYHLEDMRNLVFKGVANDLNQSKKAR